MAEVREGVYKLQFPHGGFDDFETELKINRSEQKPVVRPIGKATAIAIQSGRLLYVGPLPKAEKAEKKPE